MITVQSTGDISLSDLEQIFGASPLEEMISVDHRQYFFRSVEAPSWVQLIADFDTWRTLLGAGLSIFAAGVLAEAGKETWKKRTKALGSAKRGGLLLLKLAKSLVSLRNLVGPNTRVEVGVPLQDDGYAALLSVSGGEPDLIEAQLAQLCLHADGIAMVFAQDDFRPLGWATLSMSDGGELTIRWMDRGTLQEREKTLVPDRTGVIKRDSI